MKYFIYILLFTSVVYSDTIKIDKNIKYVEKNSELFNIKIDNSKLIYETKSFDTVIQNSKKPCCNIIKLVISF